MKTSREIFAENLRTKLIERNKKDEHKRSFWHKLIKEVKVDADGLPTDILY